MRKPTGGDRAPSILTSGTRGATPIETPFPTVVSHAVPPLPEAPGAIRAAAVSGMSLTADRTNYLVSENEWLNDVKVVEDQPFGNVTDSEGNWFGRGSPWLESHVGFWVILARTSERQTTVRFVVSADLGQPQPTPPNEMLGVTHVGGHYRFATPDSELAPE